MNTNNLVQFIQQGFRITVGATASLIETVQDPQKREATFSELQTQLDRRTQEWSQKGEMTEKEARRVVDEWLNKQRGQTSSQKTVNNDEPASTTTADGNINNQSQIKELTERIIALRNELEELRQSDN